MATVSKSRTPDTTAAAAVDVARAALLDVRTQGEIGDHVGLSAEADRVVTHYFESLDPAYVGWRWAVTVVRASRARAVTVSEVVLLPGPEALVAPPWVPWSERVRPEDMAPGTLLPTAPDDVRLLPSYAAEATVSDTEEDADADSDVRRVVDEIGLGRARVLSPDGRDVATDRWYAGSGGPDDPVARAAPAHCSSCGFLVRLRGDLGTLFGVCANEYSPSDGQVVSFDHGCGAHSEVITVDGSDPADQPHPVLDTLGYDTMSSSAL